MLNVYEPKEREEVIDRIADTFGFDEKKGDVEMETVEYDMTITIECICCEKEYTLKFNQVDYLAWKDGEKLIQNALPYLTPDERELLIAGVCGTCADKFMSGDIDSPEFERMMDKLMYSNEG